MTAQSNANLLHHARTRSTDKLAALSDAELLKALERTTYAGRRFPYGTQMDQEPEAMIAPALLTGEEAAARLAICERTLRILRQRGEIAYVALTARIVRYTVADCDAFIKSHRRVDTPRPGTYRVNRGGNPAHRWAPGGGFMEMRAIRKKSL